MIEFISSNRHKFMEIKARMDECSIGITWVKMKYEEIQADTTEEISLDSAKKLSSFRGKPFFIEDTGLYITSLNGFPGPYSSYVSKKLGNSLVLRLLEDERSAVFLTVITYWDGRSFFQFSGKLEGEISMVERGHNGFGYDPIFIPRGKEITMAEMTIEEKNEISHRAMALNKFIEFLNQNTTSKDRR